LASASDFDRLRVVLVETRNPLNLGAAARAMSNFGFRRLRVVNPYEKAFREARSAKGAARLLAGAEEFDTVAEAVADCTLVVGATAARRREVQHPLRRLEQGARLIRGHLRRGQAALLFGSEKTGLSNQDLSHCHWLLRIPTAEANLSMNLGQAVAICLYELTRDAETARQKAEPEPAAAAGEVERITMVLLEALRVSGYLHPRASAASDEKVRRLVRRLHLPARDAELWLGILRQLLWKAREGTH
jgi:tRNA/rRNA methyltransferase